MDKPSREHRIVRAHMALEAWRRGEPGHRADDQDVIDLLTDLMFLVANSGMDVESAAVSAITRYFQEDIGGSVH